MTPSLRPSFEGAVRFAQELIRLPSLPGEEEAVAHRVAAEMEALGYDEVRVDAVGNVVGRIAGGDGPTVLLNCHLDIVAAGDPGTWEVPPFEGRVEGGLLHGRGAMDIKGPLALQTHAAALAREGAPGDIVVAHTVFEERGGWGMQFLLEEGGLRPDVVIIGESTHGDVTLGHRGRAEVEVVLRGLAGHASAPDRARNALAGLPRVLDAVDRLAADQPSDPALGPATLAPTLVEVRPESRNVIPDEVVVTLDWRVLPGMGPEDLLRPVRAALGDPPEGLTWEVRMAREEQTSYTGITEWRDLFTPGFRMEADHPVVRAAARAVGRRPAGPGEGDAVAGDRGGEPGEAVVRLWTFATDGGWSAGVHGIPTVGFAPGEERYAHTNTERLDLDEARWAFGRYPALIRAVQEAAREG